jgi:hypothetical protein
MEFRKPRHEQSVVAHILTFTPACAKRFSVGTRFVWSNGIYEVTKVERGSGPIRRAIVERMEPCKSKKKR